jgi:predicted RNase H-like nuclease (RuvC/YqgF family)
MTEDLLTMQKECVESGHDIAELNALSNELFGGQVEPPAPVDKPQARNSNQDLDLLNRAKRELEATQNLAIHLKDQVTELDTAKSTLEKQVSAYKTVAESLQEEIDEVIRESDESKNSETARLVHKAVSAVNEVPATLDELGISKKQRIAAVPEDVIEAALIGMAGLREENHMHDHWRDKIKFTQPPICFR